MQDYGPARHPGLLVFRRAFAHPKSPNGRALVGEFDPYNLFKNIKEYASMTIPNTIDDDVLKKAGSIRPPDGVPVFMRNRRGTMDMKDDVMVLLHKSPEQTLIIFDEEDMRALRKVREDVLGPRESRNAGERKGTAFERHVNRSKPNGQGPHCYLSGTSVQQQKNLASPAANWQKVGHCSAWQDQFA